MDSAPFALQLNTEMLAEVSLHQTLGGVLKKVDDDRKEDTPRRVIYFAGGGAQEAAIGTMLPRDPERQIFTCLADFCSA